MPDRFAALDYSNPKLPEHINVSREHPLKEFAVLAGGILAAIVGILILAGLAADHLAARIPFHMETSLVSVFDEALPAPHPANAELQALADRLAAAMELPEEMPITVHVIDDEEINAFATLGGHVFVLSGIIESLPSENALAMLLAHEMAHVKHRHPVRAMGRGVVLLLALVAVTGGSGNDLVAGVVGDMGSITLLSFSRGQEHEADEAALEAVQRLYGHTGGALDLYHTFVDKEAGTLAEDLPAFMSTHPLTAERIRRLEDRRTEPGWGTAGAVTPLPESLLEAVEEGRREADSDEEGGDGG